MRRGEKLIFRNFQNIKIVVKILKSDENNRSLFDETEFDALFDIYLRPLKSGNVRKIFKILVEGGAVGVLTTLDIQARLIERGLRLSKKEINGWLHSLNDAGLVEKGTERGKPTTIEYDDKYTFDLWRLTDLGEEISEGIPRILGKKPSFFVADPEKSLGQISKIDGEGRELTLRRLGELYMLERVLRELFRTGGELDGVSLMRRLKPAQIELNRLLSRYFNPSRGVNLISLRPRQRGFMMRLLNTLGLTSGKDSIYALTEDGERLARALWSVEDFGHQNRL
jgi:DNA-binding transcriptional ArsR family regulator